MDSELYEIVDDEEGISQPDDYHIVEYEFSETLLEEYFDLCTQVAETKHTIDDIQLLEQKLYLDISDNEKKAILLILASSAYTQSYRILERYVQNTEVGLRDWAILAMNECRMRIENDLLEENIGMITTVLGGKGKKLRFYLCVISKNGDNFTDWQKNIINKEFQEIFDSYDCEIERWGTNNDYFYFVVLMPLTVTLHDVMYNGIEQTNQLGNFVLEDYIATNIEIPDELRLEEIKKEVRGEEVTEEIKVYHA